MAKGGMLLAILQKWHPSFSFDSDIQLNLITRLNSRDGATCFNILHTALCDIEKTPQLFLVSNIGKFGAVYRCQCVTITTSNIPPTPSTRICGIVFR